jgi:type II secretory ATPase GspE/PulE/Tfp pilus assembly ATPase PilB-like protein
MNQRNFDRDWFLTVGCSAIEQLCREDSRRSIYTGDSPVPVLVREYVDAAIRAGASDLHWEPGPDEVVLRTRYDGTLVSEHRFDSTLGPKITTHLKALANLDITERRRPQDGRLTWQVDERRIDLRMSTVPGAHGEKTVLRILDAGRLPEALSRLGMDRRTELALLRASERARGLILVTGPTGSGKSTTLYTLLKSMDRATRNVMTVEDPVEYEMPGITQVAVDARIGRTFASVLRSFLRQDPDVLLVGEVRDLETAEICIRASLTGHLVLSTLHTNDAPGAVVRLLDMGVAPFLLASSLSIVCSQRLLKQLCPACRRPDPDARSFAEPYGLAGLAGEPAATASGCTACRGTGVAGRIGVYETLIVSPEIEAAIRDRAPSSELLAIARSQGLVPLIDQGLRLVNEGQVSIREVVYQILSAQTTGVVS